MNFITFYFYFFSAIYFENFKNTVKMVKMYNAFRLLVIKIENFIKLINIRIFKMLKVLFSTFSEHMYI